MKVLVEEQVDGLVALLGQTVVLWCANYIYTGLLVGVNDHDVKLENAGIVYETGELTAASWKDLQPLPSKYWYVRTAAVESYGAVPRK